MAPRRTRRILVVDDDRDLVKSMSAVLDEAGRVVMAARDGDGALSVCRGAGPDAGRPDLVLLDLHLAAGSLAGAALLDRFAPGPDPRPPSP